MTITAASPAKPERKRRAYLPASERKRLIIAAAQQVFAKSNLQGARTRDIAKAAEVNQATIFEHFESKEALFHEAVVEPLLAAMRGLGTRAESYEAAGSIAEMQALAHGSAQKQLETLVEIFPLFTAALFSDLELGRTLYREHIMPFMQARGQAVNRLMKEDLDPELVELASFGMFLAVAMDQTLGDRPRDLGATADALVEIATTGAVRNIDKG